MELIPSSEYAASFRRFLRKAPLDERLFFYGRAQAFSFSSRLSFFMMTSSIGAS